MFPSIDTLNWIQQIHQLPGKIVLVTTGAGMLTQSWLFGVAGASQTVLEARVPYAKTAFDQFIGREPDKYVSPASGRLLAAHAFQRAITLLDNPNEIVYGLSCTATITTTRPKQGPHHAVISGWSQNDVVTYHLNLVKGLRTRNEEEQLVSQLLIHTLAQIFHVPDLPPIRRCLALEDGDQLKAEYSDWGQAIESFLMGQEPFVGISVDGRLEGPQTNPPLLFSGSFNPLHIGHLKLAEVATKMTGLPLAFELSAYNVDKSPLSFNVLRSRLKQFMGKTPLYITNAPTFIDKARLFPHTIFVVGYDTAVRIYAPRYYNNSEWEMLTILQEIRELGCRFLVAGRVDKQGVFQDASTLTPPSGFADLFTPIPTELFRQDISSTILRQTASSL